MCVSVCVCVSGTAGKVVCSDSTLLSCFVMSERRLILLLPFVLHSSASFFFLLGSNGTAQVHETVVAEKAEQAWEGSEGAFHESVTGDFRAKEYQYSEMDYNEPERDVGADVGHALAAVTHQGGVSHVALSFLFKLLGVKRCILQRIKGKREVWE